MDAESKEHSFARVAVREFFVVGFFTKVKVRSDGVFKQMDQEEADEHVKEGAMASEANRFGKDFDENDCQHVSGAQCEKILQVLPGPFPADDEVSAEEIAGSSDEAKDCGECDSEDFGAGHFLVISSELQVSELDLGTEIVAGRRGYGTFSVISDP